MLRHEFFARFDDRPEMRAKHQAQPAQHVATECGRVATEYGRLQHGSTSCNNAHGSAKHSHERRILL
jgi:hypothetical protein